MTTTQEIEHEPAAFVEAELNYLRPQATKPSSAPDAPHRRSIELRTLVFWDS